MSDIEASFRAWFVKYKGSDQDIGEADARAAPLRAALALLGTTTKGTP